VLHFDVMGFCAWPGAGGAIGALTLSICRNNDFGRLAAIGPVLRQFLTWTARRGPASRGGLACWQQKRVAAYIEEHVADDIPLATLAELAQLSPYHFSRSFSVPSARQT